MLRAHLEHKLGKVIARALADAATQAHVEANWRSTLPGDEDALTSSVLERLSYLEPQEAWNVLQRGCMASGAERFPDCPPGHPEWQFWPTLKPAPLDTNEKFVEPDVLILVGDCAVILESKHQGVQHFRQWVSQVRAVGAKYKSCTIHHLAVGGSQFSAHQAETLQAQAALKEHKEAPLATFLYLDWRQLSAALASLLASQSPHAGHRRLIHTMLDALQVWGYGRRRWLKSLPAIYPDSKSELLTSWHPVARRPRRPGLADLPCPGILSTPPSLLNWRLR